MGLVELLDGFLDLFEALLIGHGELDDLQFSGSLLELIALLPVLIPFLAESCDDLVVDWFPEFVFEFGQLLSQGEFIDILEFAKAVDHVGEGVLFIVEVLSQVADPVFELLDSFVIEALVLDANLRLEKPQSVDIAVFFVIGLQLFVQKAVFLVQGPDRFIVRALLIDGADCFFIEMEGLFQVFDVHVSFGFLPSQEFDFLHLGLVRRKDVFGVINECIFHRFPWEYFIRI